MFQQKYIEEYQNITAPIELKDRVRFSVNKARRTMKKRIMLVTAFAAGITLFCISESLLGSRSTILSVNDVVVTREALLVDNQEGVLLTEKLGHQKSLPIHIPMEIEIKGNTKIEVNVGTLMQVIGKEQYSAETTHMKLSKNATVYWMLDGASDYIPTYSIAENAQNGHGISVMDKNIVPVLTITNGRKIAQYVVEYQVDTDCYSIRKVN